MKAIYSGDWHYSLYSGQENEDTNYLTETLYYIDQTNRNICKYAVKNKIEYVIVLGDIYHTKSLIYVMAQSVLLDMTREFKELKFIFLQGNHDLSSRSKIAASTLKGFKSEPNIIVIDKTTILPEFPTSIFIPYTANIIEEVKNNKAQNLFSHFGLNEGVLNSGISIITDLSMTDLAKNYKNVLLGHYHSPQEIKGNDINIWYTGSPIQLDDGEKNEDKRFIVFDDITGEMTSVLTEGYKKLYEYKLTEENKDEVLKQSKINKELGHNVRVILTEKMETSGFDENIVFIDRIEKDIMNRGMSTTMNEYDRLKKYLQIKEIPEEEIDTYLDFAKQIIDSVNSKDIIT